MIGNRMFTKMFALFALMLPLAFTAGCKSGESTGPKTATVKPGDMPEGGNWTGVYYSEHEGYLHLVKDGSAVNARWRKASGEEWGELHGEVIGDILRFEWQSNIIGLVGPGAQKKGKGYFRYVDPGEERPHEIQGEYGLGKDEVGTTWKAVKQRNMIPDPESVMPDEVETAGGPGEGWDDEGGGEEEEGGEDEEEEVEAPDLE